MTCDPLDPEMDRKRNRSRAARSSITYAIGCSRDEVDFGPDVAPCHGARSGLTGRRQGHRRRI
jgi:hypothetical protein